MKLETSDRQRPDNGHLLTDQIKWMIIHYKIKGHSDQQTALLVGSEYNRPSLSRQTVKAVWSKYHETQGVSNQWSLQGRPFAISEQELKMLERYFKKYPKKSVNEAKADLNILASRQTINRALLEKGLKAYRAPKKFYISPTNIRKRLQFALDHQNLTLNYWKTIIFSDESSFALFNANGRLLVRRSERSYTLDNIQMDGNCQTLMVWGVISFNGVGPLVRIDRVEENENTLNGERYLTILKRYLLRNYSNHAARKLVFQQDNAPSHRYHKVQSWLDEKDIKRIIWPPQSPDMSLIENIWNELKYRLRGKVYRNKEKLWKDLQREWKCISKEYIRNLYESLPRRIGALIDADGKQTHY